MIVIDESSLLIRIHTIMAHHNNTGFIGEQMAGEYLSKKGFSNGAVYVDLDNDGDLDVVVNQYRGVAGIYHNDTTAPRLAVVSS